MILILAVLHDFVLGPRYERTGDGTPVARPRADERRAHALVLVLGVLLAH